MQGEHCAVHVVCLRTCMSPVDNFFERFTKGMEDQNKHDLLFGFLKYIGRQIVLFDHWRVI